MNEWTGMGRLVKDPDVKFTESGKCLTRFVLAINYKSNGEYRVEFIKCESWEKTAELIGEYCGKGDMILVKGRIHTKKYIKDDETRYSTVVVVNHIEFAEKKNKNTKKTPAAEQPVADMPSGSVDEWPPIDQEQIFKEDEVPF